MSKKWYSANEIVDNGKELPKDLYEYDAIMKEKPNFNHEKDCSEKIFEYKNYIVLKVKSLFYHITFPFGKYFTMDKVLRSGVIYFHISECLFVYLSMTTSSPSGSSFICT